MDLEGKKAVVIGLGISGQAAARHLLEAGAEVVLAEKDPARAPEAEEFIMRGAKAVFGTHEPELLNGCSLLIPSPGVPAGDPFLQEARKRGIEIISEVELGYRLLEGKDVTIAAITGTNGKTTATHLLGEVMQAAGRKVKVSGNIGFPFVDACAQAEPGDVLVTELSSFQLYFIRDFHPQIACLLNITEDHFDWHPGFEDYIEAKANIFKNQQPGDYALLNYEDELVIRLKDRVKASLVAVGEKTGTYSVYIDNEVISAELDGKKEVLPLSAIKLPGRHNISNVMFVTGSALLMGAPAEVIKATVAGFSGLPHRLEKVGDFKGVRFVDDSKSTNPSSLYEALGAFREPLVILAGGKNKGSRFDLLKEKVSEKDRAVILFGEAAPEIAPFTQDLKIPVHSEKTLGAAVKKAFELALNGDTVLLSPGCASFDEFNNYKERGEFFASEVKRLAEVTR